MWNQYDIDNSNKLRNVGSIHPRIGMILKRISQILKQLDILINYDVWSERSHAYSRKFLKNCIKVFTALASMHLVL